MICPTCRHPLLLTPTLMGKDYVPFKDGHVQFDVGCSICHGIFRVVVTQLREGDLKPEDLAARTLRSPVMATLKCGCTVEYGKECTTHKTKELDTWPVTL